ncbi:MAG: Uma2 family endonuclease [Acidobacteria bacterium]|nr:Uma2 family endonuclease [Acidobacteriota bacterium]
MSTQFKRHLTPEEYLAIERKAEYKSEYFNGEVFAMAGAGERHNLIVANLIMELGRQLKKRPCKVYPSDMRVKIPVTGLYTYPDVVVVCGEPMFEDEHKDTLLNPTVLIEVLSESTEAYDRGKKFEHYRSVESLSDYVLIAQDAPKIEHYVRQPGNLWLLSETSGSQDIVQIDSIQCELALTEVYDKVEMVGS